MFRQPMGAFNSEWNHSLTKASEVAATSEQSCDSRLVFSSLASVFMNILRTGLQALLTGRFIQHMQDNYIIDHVISFTCNEGHIGFDHHWPSTIGFNHLYLTLLL